MEKQSLKWRPATTPNRHLSQSACHGKQKDSTTAGELIILGMVFIPVYIYVLVAAFGGWFV